MGGKKKEGRGEKKEREEEVCVLTKKRSRSEEYHIL